MIKMISENGKAIWKYIAISTLGILLGMGAQMFREPKDVVSKTELTLLLEQQRSSVVELHSKIDEQTREIIALRATVNLLSIDTAGIAMKVGVAAHPVIVPSAK